MMNQHIIFIYSIKTEQYKKFGIRETSNQYQWYFRVGVVEDMLCQLQRISSISYKYIFLKSLVPHSKLFLKHKTLHSETLTH